MLNKMNRVLPRLAAASVVMAGALSAQAASSHAEIDQGIRPFNTRYESTLNGNIVLIGNSLLACQPGTVGFEHGTTCEAAQTPSGVERGVDNNNFDMRYLDVDGDSSTFNSSSAQLNLPPGSNVTFAGLYWGAFSNSSGEPVAAQRVVAKLRTPGSAGYSQLIATQLDDVYVSGQGNAYQGFIDVTQQVKAAGSGLYSVADVTAVQGANRYAGWVMVIAYSNPSDDLRNLVIYDGFKYDPQYKPIVIPLSGFLTPATGPVSVTLGIYGSDGDRGNIGDQMLLNNTLISNAANPPDNAFNSSISNNGANVTDRVPAYINNMSIDVDLLDASNIVPNSATSATLTISATQDKFLPGLVTFSTLVFQPAIQIETRVLDVNGGVVNSGDTLEYTIIMTNTGSIASTDTRLAANLPAGTTFVPGTLNIVSNAGGATGLQTDAAGDDLGEAGNGVLNVRIGAGASSAVGGSMAYNASATVTYRVVVTGSIANQLVLTNRSDVIFRSAGNATAVLTSSNTLNVVATPKVRVMAPIVSKP